MELGYSTTLEVVYISSFLFFPLHTHQTSPVKHPGLTTPYLSQRRSYRPRCITLTASTNALMVYAPWRGCDCMYNYDEVSAITRMFRVCRGVRIMLDGISEEYLSMILQYADYLRKLPAYVGCPLSVRLTMPLQRLSIRK
ncbi:hypothetical protein FOTG_00032 [Fusarium oxysporum f. sp. vasinfectum 25433]|uniref:Uncharacterized protein n=1 Tax=Fusarium oxysporum f. sp. vasinfectum 25433 TaxID=1089449 RepID=X0NSR3_FUSOX|nr:hypothetical protein FOTG_00032 [Fusarium oxysporum f. sp. vasinfectum 25433]